MTIFDQATLQSTPLAHLRIWRCKDGCGFHLCAGSIVLTFTPEELAAFLRAAGVCYLGEECARLEAGAEAAPHGFERTHLTEGEPEIQQLTSALEH